MSELTHTRAVAVSVPAPGVRREHQRRHGLGHAASATLLWLVAIGFLLPIVYAVATSLKPASDVFTSPPTLWGSEVRWRNYSDALSYLPFLRFILNSLFVATVGTVVTVVTSALSAYAFSRLTWRGRSAVFVAFLASLMIPQEVLVVPMFTLMQQLGWVDSYRALIFPWAFTAFGTFLLRQFFMTVPRDLDEAAVLDGASKIRIFWSVILPLARPSLAVLAVFTFITYWNSFLWPLIITNSMETKGTVPVGLSLFFSQQGSHWNLVMAASVISMVPTVALTLALRRHLVAGIATAGLGGR